MESIDNYPLNIIPLDKLKICSNAIIGGGDLIKIQDYVPLIIGAGVIPAIWLIVKINNQLIKLIDDNKSQNDQLNIVKNSENKSINILVENTSILIARMDDTQTCTVDTIDLRPIGLNIYGNNKELNVANNILSGNVVKGAKFLIGMD